MLCGVAAFWYGLQFTIAPDMGYNPVIFAFVVAFLAGTASSPIRVFFVGIGVALIEQYASIWLSVRWTQTAVFVVLVIYLSLAVAAPDRPGGVGEGQAGPDLRGAGMQIWLNYLDQILIYAAFALSLNLLLGYAGQVSVAHAAFGAIGGYTMGYLMMTRGWNFLPTALIGMVLAFIAGTIVALPALKLSVEYLILLTLAISSVIIGVFTTFPELGGTYGLIGINTPDIFGWTLNHPSDWVIPSLILVLVTYGLCRRMGESAFGRVLKGIREDDRVTQALGKNVFAYKVGVFGITAGLAGLAGAFYSGWLQLATPSVYGFSFALTLFAIVIFGGMANLTGSIVGAAAVVLLEPILRRVIKMNPGDAALWELVIYGVALVVLMMLRPQGVFPEGFSLWRLIRGKRAPTTRVEMTDTWVPTSTIQVHQVELDEIDDAERSREHRREEIWQNAPVVLEGRGGSPNASAASWRPTTSTSTFERARSRRWWDQMGPARRRCSTFSPASFAPITAVSRCTASSLSGCRRTRWPGSVWSGLSRTSGWSTVSRVCRTS